MANYKKQEKRNKNKADQWSHGHCNASPKEEAKPGWCGDKKQSHLPKGRPGCGC